MTSIAALQALRKICASCGREITWRKKWELCWDNIIYCSATCRRPLGKLDRAFEVGILDLLRTRRGIAIGSHKKGGANSSTASCTCEEVEAMVLEEWKANPLAEREVNEEEEIGSDEGELISSSPVAEVVEITMNRKERRKAEAAAALLASSNVESPETIPTNSIESSPSAKPSFIPTFPKIDSLSLSDSPTSSEKSLPRDIGEMNSASAALSPRSAPRDTRERCRKAARRLVIVSAIEIWQKGKVVDPSFAKGVMELRGGVNFDLIAVQREMEGKQSWEKEDDFTGKGGIIHSGKLGKKRKGNQKNGRANE